MSEENLGYGWMKVCKYQWDEKMGEISGMGGSYEESCRLMLLKGLEFIDSKGKDFNPRFTGMEDVYGVYSHGNGDAKALSDYVTNLPEKYFGERYGPSGAMHQAVCSSLIWIMANGWEKYKEEMSKRSRKSE
jgi:hypothetical protein